MSFKDTIIIFTSNAGKSLYEGEARQNAAGVPRKVILNALETEKDPRTGQPFFPPAITSRLATGWPLLFNHLEPDDLEVISRRESDRLCALFKKQYDLEVTLDPVISTALLFREGGIVDARTLRAQTELFFKNEIFKVCRLWGEERFPQVQNFPADVRALFFSDERPEILLYGSPYFAAGCRRKLPGFVFHTTDNIEDAMRIAGEKDIRLAIVDITERSRDLADFLATVAESGQSGDFLMSGAGFEYLPMAAGVFRDGSRLFQMLRDRLPELPVYLLETDELPLDEELTMSFVRAGARGKLIVPAEDFSVLEDQLDSIARQLFSQSAAAKLASEHKVLTFETAPRLSEDGQDVTVRLREFSLHRAPAAEDAESVLDEAEKPDVRFADVIGCKDAKDEEMTRVPLHTFHVHLQSCQEHDIVYAHLSEDLERTASCKDIQSEGSHKHTCQHHAYDMRDAQLTHDDRSKEYDEQHHEENHRGIAYQGFCSQENCHFECKVTIFLSRMALITRIFITFAPKIVELIIF